MAVQNEQDKTIIMMAVVVCSFQVRITMATLLFILCVLIVTCTHFVCFCFDYRDNGGEGVKKMDQIKRYNRGNLQQCGCVCKSKTVSWVYERVPMLLLLSMLSWFTLPI